MYSHHGGIFLLEDSQLSHHLPFLANSHPDRPNLYVEMGISVKNLYFHCCQCQKLIFRNAIVGTPKQKLLMIIGVCKVILPPFFIYWMLRLSTAWNNYYISLSLISHETIWVEESLSTLYSIPLQGYFLWLLPNVYLLSTTVWNKVMNYVYFAIAFHLESIPRVA